MNKALGAYVLEFGTPIRAIRTALDAAPSGAVSTLELAKTYQHFVSTDLVRVRRYEVGIDTDDKARQFLLAKAARRLAKWLVIEETDDDLLFSLKPGKTPDDLRWDGERIAPNTNPHGVFGNPFGPMKEFTTNIRDTGKDDTSELKESMQTFGWVAEFPAIQDEHGIVLMGHRRLAVAKELGIEPVIKTISFGDGDQADAKRLTLALASNLGGKPMTAKDRKRIASVLYKEHDFSMEKIGEMLKVSQATISRDLDELFIVNNSGAKKGRGRPRKSNASDPLLDRLRELDKAGKPIPSQEELAKEFNVSSTPIRSAYYAFSVEKEAKTKAAEPAPRPTIAESTPAETKTCPHCGHPL